MQKNKVATILTFAIVAIGMLVIPVCADGFMSFDDPLSAPSIYKPICLSCQKVTPVPTPVVNYEKVGLGISVGQTTLKSGRSTTLSGYQTSGTPLGPLTSWSWMIQPSSGIGYGASGQNVQITVRSFGRWSITLSVSDPSQNLIGSTTSRITFTEKR